jgi:hypothetical protein
MLYSMYEIMPNVRAYKEDINIRYNEHWMPIWVWYNDDDDIY